MLELSAIRRILERYPDVVVQSVEPLGGAGGYSGAAFWKVHSPDQVLCLRRWPKEHPSQDRLKEIHDVLSYVAENGFAKVTAPIPLPGGHTFVSDSGYLWELTHWLAGKADFHEMPHPERLDAALVALAEFHRGAASFVQTRGVPPGIAGRLRQLNGLCQGGVNEFTAALSKLNWPEFNRLAATVLQLFSTNAVETKRLLEIVSHFQVLLQPCIRDIWHDHVLFEGNEVSGFVDFGAMRVDHVACDISRLLGSFVGSDRQLWPRGLRAYESLRPLSDDEKVLVETYDRSTVLLSGVNWVQWIAVEGREFSDRRRVLKRMEDIVGRMSQM